VLLTGVAAIWLGNEWPTDVLAGYAVGGLLLVVMVALYRNMDPAWNGLPFVHAGYIPHDESRTHAHALTSTIVFDDETVAKIYSPGFLPRLIYWLAFQARFPYTDNQAALRAAVLRRNLAGMLTEYWFGMNLVARAIRLDTIDGRQALVSERIRGHVPTDRDAARAFLLDLADRFDAAGFTTWQIDPRQPRAIDNILETDDGRYHVIDLESGLVSPLESPRAWRRAFRFALVPLYDDVFFPLTREYVQEERAAMVAARGEDWYADLVRQLDATEAATAEWHASEPRIWSHGVWRVRHPLGAAAGVDDARSLHALRWIEESIWEWERDGRITDAEATKMRAELTRPQFLAVLPHFGVHLAIGVALRFPVGSITRATYTLANLLAATVRFLTRRIDRRTWSDQVGVHHPLVVIGAGMPGIGTFAYLLSRPFRGNHLLMRVVADGALVHLPWRLYERTNLRWLLARPTEAERTRPRTAARIAVPAQGVVFVMGALIGGLFAADVVSKIVTHVGLLDAEEMGWKQVRRILDLGAETSLGTWYQVTALTILAGLLATVGLTKRQRREPFAWHWLGLGFLVLGFSIDEQAKIHDAGGGTDVLRDQLGMGGMLYFGWVLVGLLSAGIVAAIFWRFFWDLDVATRFLFAIAAVLFVGGEVGLEAVSGWIADNYGTASLGYQVVSSIEELLGMAGVLVAIAGVLQVIQIRWGEVRLAMGSSQEPGQRTASPIAERTTGHEPAHQRPRYATRSHRSIAHRPTCHRVSRTKAGQHG
jgi:hypothetical protein